MRNDSIMKFNVQKCQKESQPVLFVICREATVKAT